MLRLMVMLIGIMAINAQSSDSPSQSPTLTPTSSPTLAPSIDPSCSPTYEPSNSPSLAPLTNPTLAPTQTPTTDIPSCSPTNAPSTGPSTSPSLEPSLNPTLEPTQVPTSTYDPSYSPTNSPTSDPTSARPSNAPSVKPSNPSAGPSRTPSGISSRQPTVRPTAPVPILKSYNPLLFYDSPDLFYSWQSAYPQSCECVENGVAKSQCDMFKCTCACDLTAAVCDFNCCCDPDCTVEQVDRFRTNGHCDFEGFTPSDVEYCYSSTELYAVNPRSPMGGQSTAQQAVGKALCVTKRNYALKGDYFDNVDVQNSDIFTQSKGKKEYDYTKDALSKSMLYDDSYDKGDLIRLFHRESSNFNDNGAGYLQLPAPGIDGTCNDYNFVVFQEEVYPATKCVRTLSNDVDVFSRQCASSQSIDAYFSDLFVSTHADKTTFTLNSLSDTTKIDMSTVLFEDYFTSDLFSNVQETFVFECATTVRSFPFSHKCILSENATIARFVAAGTPVICNNFVRDVAYQIYHRTNSDGVDVIDSVYVDITLTDVPFSNITTTDILQSFSVQFFSSNTDSQNAEHGNVNIRYRSGNPGYLIGKPVLYGYYGYSAGEYIREFLDGFSLPSALTAFSPVSDNNDNSIRSTCPQFDLNAGKGMNGLNAVKFGYDMSSGCTIALSRSELIDYCCANSVTCSVTSQSPYLAANGMPYFLNFSQGTPGYVGIYGNADPGDVTQWIPMDYGSKTASSKWSEATSTCSDMITGIDVKFLVTRTGEKANPQNKIISARTDVVTSDNTFTLGEIDSAAKQTFSLTTTVSFIYMDSAITGYSAPAPPVLFTVPYDVFYPFYTSSDARKAASYNIAIYMIAWATSSMGVWLLFS